jgi:uncharacterized protein YneF (UPF0154 family)
MKEILKWILIFLGFIIGLFFVIKGFSKAGDDKNRFLIRHLFQNMGFRESSGTQLIIEGIVIVALSLTAMLFMIF